MHISAPGSWRCSERIRHHFRPRKWRLLREKSQMRTWTKHLFSRDAKPIPAPSASASILPLKTCHLTFARRLLTAKPTLQADYLLAPSSSAGCEPNYCTPPCRVSIAAHRLQAWPPHTRQDADSEVCGSSNGQHALAFLIHSCIHCTPCSRSGRSYGPTG